MHILTARGLPRSRLAPRRPTWGTVAGLVAVAGGAAITGGAFLPWVETFAGLIPVPGIRGGNGRILAAAGVLVLATGVLLLIRGTQRSRWAAGLTGFGCLAFSGYLLIQLAATMRALGGDAMVIARPGPGLPVCAAGSLAAFATLFLPAPQRPVRLGPDARAAGRSLRVWAAGQASAGQRRWLPVALGLVWIADAALQYQPAMFGPAFSSHVLAPAAMGNPPAVAGLMGAVAALVATHPVAFNAGFATIQLLLGLGLLFRQTTRAALTGTVAWSVAVWWLGEGLGGVLTGTASPLTGAPGAAVLYALLAIIAWPSPEHDAADRGGRPAGVPAGLPAAAASPLGRHGSKLPWMILWGSAAYLMLQPASRAPGGISAAVAGQAAGEPGWLAGADRAIAAAASGNGLVIALALAVLFAVIGCGVAIPALTRPVLVAAMLLAIALWVFAENFGGILTGLGTDPNTGPLLILLALCYWPPRERPARVEPAANPIVRVSGPVPRTTRPPAAPTG
jgi:hypothetical protein